MRLRSDNSGKRKTLSDRLAAARARAGAKSHPHKASTYTAASPSASAGAYGSGVVVNRSAVGRAKETQMLQYYFIDHPQAIKVLEGVQVPFPHELDDEMDLPNSKAIFNTAAHIKDLTITDFFKAKEKAISSWPLMGFQEFMRICRKGQRMCQRSKKPAAIVNAAALGELMDICLRTHRNYKLMNALGQDEERFKARMYLHLQYACQNRVLHASAIAMTVFEDATDPFVARLPARTSGGGGSKTPRSKLRSGSGTRQDDNHSTPMQPTSGCYLCPATDHYCSDPKFHPKVNGKHKPLTDAEKEAIIERIESSDLSRTLKNAELKSVRRYWLQHGL